MTTTKPNYRVLVLALLASFAGNLVAAPIGTAFTYQGRLASGTNAANGLYDFSFALFDDASAGTQQGPTLTTDGVAVDINGLFMVTLDFGGVFDGEARWLAVEVKTNGAGSYTALTPRQPLTPTPYALFASGLSSNVNQTFTGTVNFSPGSGPPFAVSSSTKVVNLNADLLDGLDSSAFWQLGGNAGTTAGVNFLGTSDDQALELKVNGIRALRLEPASGTPNVIGGGPNNTVENTLSAFIGGGSGNSIQNGAAGSAIAGGTNNMIIFSSVYSTICGGSNNIIGSSTPGLYGTGYQSFIGGGAANWILGGAYATIGGGSGNVIYDASSTALPADTWGDTISGGTSNRIYGYGRTQGSCTIGGGLNNSITGAGPPATGGTIAGGTDNQIDWSLFGSIAGGCNNQIDSFHDSAIGGGAGNGIGDFMAFGDYGRYGTIAGGSGNFALQSYGTIGGGKGNSVVGGHFMNQTIAGTVAGGESNLVDAAYGSIGGGRANTIEADADNSVIAGGIQNRIEIGDSGPPSEPPELNTISGGGNNVIRTWAGWPVVGNTIAGGSSNRVVVTSRSYRVEYAAIGGGYGNSSSCSYSTIGGGLSNGVGATEYLSPYSTIGGGRGNSIGGGLADTIGGGDSNSCGSMTGWGTISGGLQNRSWGPYSTIGGGCSNYIHYGSMATIGGGYSNVVTGWAGTIPGGVNNVATNYAFAAGRRAKALQEGSFVWADATDRDYAPWLAQAEGGYPNSFNARATGGFFIWTGVDPVSGDGTSGVYIRSGESGWSSLSDRNAKTNFMAVDGREILNRLAAIPLLTWNYKSADPSVRHIGPMAQDFNGAFGVGSADKTGEKRFINSVDADGVALAAIQGLNEVVKEKDGRIEALEKDVAELKALVNTLVQKTSGGGQ